MLDGIGQVSGNLTNTSGEVRPGTSPGTLAVTGAYTQGAGGTLKADVNGAAAFDRLNVTGAATLNGTLAIVQGGGFDPANSETFQVVTSGSRTGTFSSVIGTALPGNRTFSVNYPGAPNFGAQLVIDLPGAPTPGTPAVTGTMAVGQIVTCDEGTWGGSPTFTYVWLRDGNPIGGEIARTSTLSTADAGHDVACRVTGTNAGGSASATSADRAVPAVTPQNTSAPSVTGTSTLTCDPGTWTGAPAPTFTFEWLRDGTPIAGEVSSTHTVTDADAGHTITCKVTGTNAGGSDTATSNGVAIPTVAPQNTSAPTSSGTGPLTCTPGTWTGSPAPTLTVEWLRDDTPDPRPDQLHLRPYQRRRRAHDHLPRDRHQRRRHRTVHERRLRRRRNRPHNTVAPTISGTTTLTCNPGTWTGLPAPTFTFEWLRDATAIPGETTPPTRPRTQTPGTRSPAVSPAQRGRQPRCPDRR